MKKYLRHILLLLLPVFCLPAEAEPSKAMMFFYRTSSKVDNYLLRGMDTSFIALPEHSWSLALTNGEVGLHSTYTTWADPSTPISLLSRSTPSIELGFNAGYRGFGFGYSWDLLNAYTRNWNISMGGKSTMVEFVHSVSTNMSGQISIADLVGAEAGVPDLKKGDIRTAYTSLSAMYVLNSKHYSHNAAVKQSYIQKKSAGSLLLSVAYMSSSIAMLDTIKFHHDESMIGVVDGVSDMVTRQVAIGLGYGINYTPNKGKVLLHASANMQVICYSINHISYAYKDASTPGTPQYELHPSVPVHVTGNMRAAVSWEVNRWFFLSLWAQANHLQFYSKSDTYLTVMSIRDWHWQAHLNIGFRFGAGRERVQRALGISDQPIAPAIPKEPSRIPRWIDEFFFSSAL